MNSQTPDSPEDRLLDELLREQAHGPDEAFLQQIENAVDASPAISVKGPAPRRYGRLAIAAGVGLAAGVTFFFHLQSWDAQKAITAKNEAAALKEKNALEAQQLGKAIRDQEDKVEERRKVLATIVRTKGDNQGAQSAQETFHQLEQEKMQLESQINSLLKYDGDQLIVYAAGLNLPDNNIKNLYPQYLESNLRLSRLKTSGMGDNHPTVKAAKEQIEEMKRQLDEGVVNLRATLQAQLNMAGDRLKSVEMARNYVRESAIKSGLDAQDYVDARKDYETDRQHLRAMKDKYAAMGGKYEIPASESSLPGAGAEALPPVASRAVPETEVRYAQKSIRERDEQTIVEARQSDKAIRDQEDKVEERRKALATIVRTKGIIYKGQDSFYGNSPARQEEIQRGLGTQDASDGNSGDRYGTFIEQPWKTPEKDPLSTFSIDVDTASYGNVRRMIREGRAVPKDAVRIEEFINAFSYHYAQPKGEGPFAVGATIAACPWAPGHQLVRVAIKGREIETNKRPASNLVFLIDVSGSMQSPDKLPLLKQSMALLVEQLDERDRVAIVVYAGKEGVALPSTRIDEEGRAAVLKALSRLDAGGSTNGGAGIKLAYDLAMKEKIQGGVNRVILATDGDFNVGVTGQGSLVELVKDRAKGGVYLTVAGFGTGNLNDAMMDAITHDGNGNYFYIDSEREGRKVFLKNLTGTLVTIAKDVKIQVEFNPAKVGSYRLIGYANRVLRNEDFNNDKVDAGDIGAGHTVTAFYELTPPGAAAGNGLKYQATPEKPAASAEWLTVKLRHKHPEGDESSKIEFPLTGDASSIEKADSDFQFATAAALLGMKLRGMEEVRDTPWEKVLELAKPGLADDASEDRAEFVELVKKLGGEVEAEPSVSLRKAGEPEEVDGPNVRTMRHEDGSRAMFTRSPDLKTLTRKTFSANGVLTMLTVYKMDSNQNPLGCKIYDGQNNELFKVSYGYQKSTGLLVEEKMFDARVRRINPANGEEMPVQLVVYLYDAEGKRSAPIIYNLLPGKTFEEVFGIKTTALVENPFLERIVPAPAEVSPENRR
ncbi:MAG: von Willebrand factor type A domain-containing protein [Luteolibacter sp.]